MHALFKLILDVLFLDRFFFTTALFKGSVPPVWIGLKVEIMGMALLSIE
jgi:hypothetical protein